MIKRKDEESTSLGAKTAKTASFVVFGKVASLLIAAIMFIVIARILSASNYGIYIIALGVNGFIGAFGNFSNAYYFNKYIPKFLAKKQYELIGRSIGDSFLFLFVVGIILISLGLYFSVAISNYIFHNTQYLLILDAAISTVIFSMFYSTSYSILISFGDGTRSAYSSLVQSILQLFASVALVLLGYGVFGAIVGFMFGLFISIILNIWYISKHSRIILDLNDMRMRIGSMLKFSLPLTLSYLTNMLVNNFSVIFLGALTVPGITIIVGNYGVSTKIGTLIDVVITAIGFVLISMFSTVISNKRSAGKLSKIYHYSIYFGLLVTAPLIVYISVFSKDIIFTLFNPTYSLSVIYMPLVSIGLLIGAIASFPNSLAISLGKVKEIFKYSVIIGIVDLISLLILVPAFNALGVIVAVLFIGNIASVYLYFKYIRSLHITIDFGLIMRVVLVNLILALITAIVLFITSNSIVHLLIGILALLFVYPILLVLFKAARKEDVALLSKVSEGIPVVGVIVKGLISYTQFFVK